MPPEIDNDKAEKTFRLRLPKQKLQSEAQLLALASLGANLTPPQAAVVAFLLLRGVLQRGRKNMRRELLKS